MGILATTKAVMPAQAGIQSSWHKHILIASRMDMRRWIPAKAGMTLTKILLCYL
jgi:hypothetical protein